MSLVKTARTYADAMGATFALRLINESGDVSGGTGINDAAHIIIDPYGNIIDPRSPYPLTPLGYQQLTSITSATSLTVPSGATIAKFGAEVAHVRYRDDGTSPTASIGMLLNPGEPFEYCGTLSDLSFIGLDSTAILNISYYK